MDAKWKYGLIIGGGALIVGYALLNRANAGHPTDRADPNVLNAQVAMNAEAMRLRTVVAETAADVAMNRDKVSGATAISAMQQISMMVAGGQELTARLDENRAGIINARIYAETTRAVESTRASVAKYIAKKQAKVAKQGATLGFFGELGGNVVKAIPSIMQAFG